MTIKCSLCSSSQNLIAENMFDDRYGCPLECSLYRCSKCELITTSPHIEDADLPFLYEKYYLRKLINLQTLERESKNPKGFFINLQRWLKGLNHLGQYRAKKNDVVLDFGAGSCSSLLELNEMGAIAYGLEADPSVNRIADYFGLNVFIGRLVDSPYVGMKFDLIILNQVIEHLSNPSEVLKGLKGMLKEDKGVVVISCPNTNSVYRYFFGKHWINWHLPFHRNHYNRTCLKLLAENCGYRLIRYQTITPNAWTEIQIQNLFNKYIKALSSDPWVGEHPAHKNKIGIVSRLFRKIIWLSTSLLVVIFNRIVDFFSYGDSIICELQPIIIVPGENKERS